MKISKFPNIQSRHLSEIFKNKNVILSHKQSKNLLGLLTGERFSTETNAFVQQNGLFKCSDIRFKFVYCILLKDTASLCQVTWDIMQSHVTCRSINIIYYLKCNTCKKKEIYIGKTVGNHIVIFKSRMNQRISDSRTGVLTCKFPVHVYNWGLKNKCVNKPFYEINIMMKLKSSNQSETYENYCHKKVYDILNWPAHLDK